MSDETQDIPLSPAGVEAAHRALMAACCDPEQEALGATALAIRAYLPHHQPAPVPPVTAEDVAHVQADALEISSSPTTHSGRENV